MIRRDVMAMSVPPTSPDGKRPRRGRPTVARIIRPAGRPTEKKVGEPAAVSVWALPRATTLRARYDSRRMSPPPTPLDYGTRPPHRASRWPFAVAYCLQAWPLLYAGLGHPDPIPP